MYQTPPPPQPMYPAQGYYAPSAGPSTYAPQQYSHTTPHTGPLQQQYTAQYSSQPYAQPPPSPLYPQNTSIYQPLQPQHTYSQFPIYAPSPAPAASPNPLAIPAPVQRVDYQAPVFKTFQERKREREAALRAAAGTPPPTPPQRPRAPVPPSPATPASPVRQPQQQQLPPSPLRHQPPPSPTRQVQPPTPLRQSVSPSPSRGPSPAPRSVSPGQMGQGGASPAAIAMMARGGGGRPVPPPRQQGMVQQPTGTLPQATGMMGQQPTGMSGYAPPPSPAPRNVSPPQMQMSRSPSPAPPGPPQIAPPRSVSPAPPQIVVPGQQPSRSASPVPPALPQIVVPGSSAPRSASPAPPAIPKIVAPSSPSPPVPQIVTPSSPSPPLPPQIVAPPQSRVTPPPVTTPTSPTSPTTSLRSLPRPAAKSVPNVKPGGPKMPKPAEALVERSDTLSSVKSLDRSMGMKRTLPRPPVGVTPSRSLDRGPAPNRVMGGVRRASPIEEEGPEQLAQRMANVSVGSVVPSRVPRRGAQPSPPTQPSISVVSPPSKPVKVGDVIPSISVGTPPTPTVPTIAVAPPAIMVDAIPSISVGSPPAINVDTAISPPTINVDPASPRIAPSPPGVAFAGLPTIEVESGDTRDPRHAPGPSRIQPTAAILCAGCHNPIIGRIVSAMGQRWHPQCFQCGVCGEALEHVSAYEHEGRPYCHLDYHDRFAHRCHHCRTPIVDARFITLDNELGQRHYHELHFFCSECGDPFLDPSKSSAAGTELNAAEESETSDFVVHKGHPYCERCHVRLHKPRCKACRQPIPDVAVSAMGAKWHTGCFVCATCAHPFANNLFFPRDGKAYCTECFEGMN